MQITCAHKASRHGIPVFIKVFKDGPAVLEYATGIKMLRGILNISTKQLATACGVSQRTVEGWELGRWAKQTPNAAALNVMAQLLQSHQSSCDAPEDGQPDEVAAGSLTEKEQKLVRLMLDPAAQSGEIANSALKFAESLRRRGVKSLTPRSRKRSPFRWPMA